MPDLQIRAGASRGKFGILSIFNADGTRAQADARITAAQLLAVQRAAAGYTAAHSAIGITRRVFDEGRWMLAGYDHDVGDYHLEPDGTMVLKYDEQTVNGVYTDFGAQVAPGSNEARIPDRRLPREQWQLLGTVNAGRTILTRP